MSRVQLALNVSDLEKAITFYTRLFGTRPTKVKDGYANFAIDEPPLKLVLFEGEGSGGTINHLGVEVFSKGEVRAATARLVDEGLPTLTQHRAECCHSVQDKVWVTDPDGARWEYYTVLADSEKAQEVESCC
ncbi:MAG: ArsI/CadI family heavy metal resistance metalloenzyme [Actinomycetota bacterium]